MSVSTSAQVGRIRSSRISLSRIMVSWDRAECQDPAIADEIMRI
jgi:hypothetical protein